jgi:hypothetical protein
MTLIEALQKLESFSLDLKSIVEDPEYMGFDRIIEQNCLSISEDLMMLEQILVELSEISLTFIINGIDYRYNKIYYSEELNKIFEKNNINHFDIRQSILWYTDNYLNIDQYFLELQNLIVVCRRNYKNIYGYMNQKFADRFYNR